MKDDCIERRHVVCDDFKKYLCIIIYAENKFNKVIASKLKEDTQNFFNTLTHNFMKIVIQKLSKKTMQTKIIIPIRDNSLSHTAVCSADHGSLPRLH